MATLTLEDIPEDLLALLKESAERNHRSLDSEVLIRLGSSFTAPVIHAQPMVDHALMDRFKRQGRM